VLVILYVVPIFYQGPERQVVMTDRWEIYQLFSEPREP
jgi:hypothetical protein